LFDGRGNDPGNRRAFGNVISGIDKKSFDAIGNFGEDLDFELGFDVA
jgi:hypothetical protein